VETLSKQGGVPWHVTVKMHKYKKGALKKGKSKKKVQSRKQAIAIGLSAARKESTELACE
jgi:hypothetical protein